MKIIQRPSKIFDCVLPKPSVETGNYVPSVFNFFQEYNHTVLFNTLTRCFACIEKNDKEVLNQNTIFVDAANCNSALKELIELRFLVPEGFNEIALYEEIYETKYIMMQKKREFASIRFLQQLLAMPGAFIALSRESKLQQ